MTQLQTVYRSWASNRAQEQVYVLYWYVYIIKHECCHTVRLANLPISLRLDRTISIWRVMIATNGTRMRVLPQPTSRHREHRGRSCASFAAVRDSRPPPTSSHFLLLPTFPNISPIILSVKYLSCERRTEGAVRPCERDGQRKRENVSY